MKDSPISVLKHAVVILLCLVLISTSWHGEDQLFGALIRYTRWSAWGLMILVVGLIELTGYKKSKSYRAFSATGILLATGLLMIGIERWTESQWRSKPIIMGAGQFQDFNGSSLSLYSDGSYRYCDIVFDELCCTGQFTMKGDTVLLTNGSDCKQGGLVIVRCSADTTRRCLHWLESNLPEMWLHKDNR